MVRKKAMPCCGPFNNGLKESIVVVRPVDSGLKDNKALPLDQLRMV